MADYREVPVMIAKEIAEIYGKNQVVILCYDAEHELTHTTTYGVTAFDKENAAAVGQKVTQAIGCDLGKKHVFEDFHQDYDPAFFKEAIDLLRVAQRRQGFTDAQLQAVEELLKKLGHRIRHG
jgi:hypothetical protein